MFSLDCHPEIVTEEINGVYTYDYGATVDVVNWNEHGRQLFYRWMDSKWYVCSIEPYTQKISDTPPPWEYVQTKTLKRDST